MKKFAIDTYELMMATTALYKEKPNSTIKKIVAEYGEIVLTTTDGMQWVWDGLDISEYEYEEKGGED